MPVNVGTIVELLPQILSTLETIIMALQHTNGGNVPQAQQHLVNASNLLNDLRSQVVDVTKPSTSSNNT